MSGDLPEQVSITVTRTNNAPGIDNEWVVDMPGHHSYHRDVDMALLTLKVLMERVQAEQVHR